MAETNSNASGAVPVPVVAPGQTTSAGENAQPVEAQTLEGAATEQKTPGFFEGNGILWIIVIAAWFYFIFGSKKRRNQKAQEKKEKERRDNLKAGDRLVTIGRMHGTVVDSDDETVTLKPDPKAAYTMKFDKQAIYRVLPRPGEEDEEDANKEENKK